MAHLPRLGAAWAGARTEERAGVRPHEGRRCSRIIFNYGFVAVIFFSVALAFSNFLRPLGRIFGIIVAFRGDDPQGPLSLTYSRAQVGPGPAARERGIRQGRVATSVDLKARHVFFLRLDVAGLVNVRRGETANDI